MPQPRYEPDPAELPIHRAFRKSGVDSQLAYTAVQGIRSIAGANILLALETKIESFRAEIRASLSEFRAEMSDLRAEVTELRAEVVAVWGKMSELRAEVTELRTGQAVLTGRIAVVEAKIEDQTRLLKWVIGLVISVLMAVLVLLAGFIVQNSRRYPQPGPVPSAANAAPAQGSDTLSRGSALVSEPQELDLRGSGRP